MAEIEEQFVRRVMRAHQPGDTFEELDLHLFREAFPVRRVRPIQFLFLHAPLRRCAAGFHGETDIDENTVILGMQAHHLVELATEIVQVGRSEIKIGPSGTHRCCVVTRQRALGRDDAPFWMFRCRKLVPACGDVDRYTDIGGTAGGHLRAEQVEIEMRMDPANFRRMIGPAVMAFGEHGDGIDGGFAQGAHETLGIKTRADIRDQAGGMKIEMNVTVAHML